jgi:hypothetical protein
MSKNYYRPHRFAPRDEYPTEITPFKPRSLLQARFHQRIPIAARAVGRNYIREYGQQYIFMALHYVFNSTTSFQLFKTEHATY